MYYDQKTTPFNCDLFVILYIKAWLLHPQGENKNFVFKVIDMALQNFKTKQAFAS